MADQLFVDAMLCRGGVDQLCKRCVVRCIDRSRHGREIGFGFDEGEIGSGDVDRATVNGKLHAIFDLFVASDVETSAGPQHGVVGARSACEEPGGDDARGGGRCDSDGARGHH